MILKSGEQKVKYKIFSNGKNIDIGFDIYIVNKGKVYKNIVDIEEEEVKMPPSGVYEGEFIFMAEVPYENKGWSDGEDLRKFNREEVEQAVVDFYKKMWNIYNDKTAPDVLFPYIEKKDRELAQAHYQSKQEIEVNFDTHMRPFKNKSYELQPLENYKMVLYGEGRVASLEQTSMDIRLRGRQALWAKFRFEGKKSINTSFPHMYLYLPKGKKLRDGLQIIR